MEPHTGAAIRVTVNAAEWPDAPETVMASGRVTAVEPARPGSETHTITLDCGSAGCRSLMVVPPDEPAGTAARPPALAATPGNPLTAARVLALADSGRLGGTPG
ncbi:DUF5994 family protein [Streptomyces sp. NPDC059168]|uniref:DUF5994 family protein n=1 Tax=Streptomyces sp. NPDC059168 TaxID=3346753 RepID=UPI00369F6CAC